MITGRLECWLVDELRASVFGIASGGTVGGVPV